MGALEIAILLFGAAVLVSAHLISRRQAPPTLPPLDQRIENRFELLETKLTGVKSDLRKMSGEWVDYHSRLDTLIRRGIRLGVLERQDKASGEDDHNAAAPEAPDVPQTRGALVAEWRKHNATGQSGP